MAKNKEFIYNKTRGLGMLNGSSVETGYYTIDGEAKPEKVYLIRLTENNIIQVGTYGEKISVVYDISIKKPGSDKYYTKSVMSTLGVPVSQKLNKKNSLTGESVK